MFFCGYESVTIFRQQTMDNMSEHTFAEITLKKAAIICVLIVMPTTPHGARNGAARCPPPGRCNQPRIQPTRREAQAIHMCVHMYTTTLATFLRRWRAAPPPPHRPHLGHAGLAPQPTYLGRAGPKQLGRAVKASLICAKTFREHVSV